jgi:hypothetical protein
LPEFNVELGQLQPDGITLDEETSLAFIDHIHEHVCDAIGFFENRNSLNGTVVTLDENSNEQSSDGQAFSSSFNFEGYSTPQAPKVVQSGVSGYRM